MLTCLHDLHVGLSLILDLPNQHDLIVQNYFQLQFILSLNLGIPIGCTKSREHLQQLRMLKVQHNGN